MSLNNIIKSLHNRGEDSVTLVPSIEQYFMSRSRSTDYKTWLDKMTRFHPSKVTYSGVCSRAYNLFMQRERLGLEFELPEPHETSLLRIFELGHSIHDMYQNKILGQAGVLFGKWKKAGQLIKGFYPGEGWLYEEPRIKWPKYNMSGYCDGIVVIDGSFYLLEIKSSNSQSFKYMKAIKTPRESHVKQAQLYIHAPNDLELDQELKGCIILYINKDTGEELEFFIKKDQSTIQPILDAITEAKNDLENNIIQSRLSECKTSRSKRAKDCLSCTQCFMRDSYV